MQNGICRHMNKSTNSLVSTVVIPRKDYLTATVNMQQYHVISIIMDLLGKTVVIQSNRPS